MEFRNVAIETLAFALPDEIWTSEAMEKRLAPVYERLRLPEGRLELMTGIRERRMWVEGTQPSQASAWAGQAALNKSGLKAEQLDVLMHTAVSRDRLEPATAAYVHEALKLPAYTQFFDVSNACLGFLNALVLAGSMIEAGQIKAALVTAGENGRPLVEGTLNRLLDPSLTRQSVKPFFANLTVGCGAVAAVVAHKDLPQCQGKPLLRHSVLRADTLSNRLCEGGGEAGGLEMQTQSEELLEAGIVLAEKTWEAFTEESGWDAETPDRVVCHQVGKQHQRRLYEALKLDLQKDYSTFPFLGNVGSVSLPITLAHAMEAGAVSAGMKVALLGIGSGLSSMMLALET